MNYNINNVWFKLLAKIMHYGIISNPRNMETRELIAYQSIVNMNRPIIVMTKRKMNYKFMFGEAWWILSGSNRVNEITPFMKAIEKFSDDGYMFNGAYGPKLVDQLGYVVDCLSKDKDSRQAIINIWRENPRPSKDIPCTLNLQWLIRNNQLHCKVNMRSSDAWLGWVYDTFNFSMISAWVAIALRGHYPNLELGNLYLDATSQHLYKTNFDLVSNVLERGTWIDIKPIDLYHFQFPDELTQELYHAGLEQWELVNSPFLLQIKEFT